ncbi:hypothetical protein ANME2D_00338 [Candidatus Methanoperedens nitroreducens]|uniref:Uncharacterized protein n=1 Tax=Candidatus Methanoperedens nitratireducens TaxID=1392998 RepID=A0A062V7J0_9EURY|nr:PsbP-related protein [Candidatus Methanoperedens nitroreducens]KCZ73272.1 hypothetical protein ANME2D_00338 [Candidatus Methanoperedens nitroreducens]MDJ1422780.1 PsbP-related protein [Candidatus Methanoperedens sp.]
MNGYTRSDRILEQPGTRKLCPGMSILIIFFLVILSSGCIGSQTYNLTIFMPESIEVLIGEQDVLEVGVMSPEVDATDIVVSLSVPPEISLVDQQYSKEVKILPKDQKVIIPFNYSALSDGTFNLTLEVKTNINTTNYTITVNSYVPAPKLEIGEFWIYNQTKGKASGLQAREVTHKDTIEDREYYVIKETWEGDLNGTYALSYYSVDDFSLRMTEYYEDGSLLRGKTIEMDPPGSNFPFKIGMKETWSGSITGIGKTEINGEVVKKEKITVPGGTYTGYYLRKKMSYSMATGVGEGWYVPELNGFAKYRMSTNALGTTTEDELELLEYGKLPAKPRQIQPDIKLPEGYKLYKNDELNFRIAYPKNWDFSSTEDRYGSSFEFSDGSIYTVQVVVESVGKLNLAEYRETRLEYLKKLVPGLKISEEKNVTINGRDGLEWVYEYPPIGFKAKQVIFVVDGKGYTISGYSLGTVYNSYKPMFDNIVNSFFIKGSPNKYILS